VAAVLLDWRVKDVAAITVFIDDRRANIQVSGRLDVHSMHQLRSQVETLLDSGITDLLVDLVDAYDLDPGLSELLSYASSMLSVREGLLLTESTLVPLPGDITAQPLTDLFKIYQRVRENHGVDAG
jgi:hypothetical protein